MIWVYTGYYGIFVYIFVNGNGQTFKGDKCHDNNRVFPKGLKMSVSGTP